MKKVNLLFVFLISLSVFSQSDTSLQKDEKPYIEVTGVAEKEIVPDEIYISIVLQEKYEGKNKITIEEQESKLKASLQSAGIDIKNLELSDANSDYMKVRKKTKDVITKKDYSLKVTNAENVGAVFKILDDIDIKDASIERVSHSRIEEYKKEVKILAIQAAKAKADYLLNAIGEQTGKPLVIKEIEINNNIPIALSNVAYRNDSYGSKFDEAVIQFKKIKLQTSIYAKFNIQ
jgi:uncharacterized protein YggE